MLELKPITSTLPYFKCTRCSIDSLTEGRMCPCPRGSCEAENKGRIVKTTQLILDKK